LSGGQAQRVVITMAVLHRPKLLIVDEPTSALDPATGPEILALFRKCNRKFGAAILYVSHDLASVASLCHRVAVMYESSRRRLGLARRGSANQPNCQCFPRNCKTARLNASGCSQ
jgi:ABC-type glutathione transport system ATPase component